MENSSSKAQEEHDVSNSTGKGSPNRNPPISSPPFSKRPRNGSNSGSPPPTITSGNASPSHSEQMPSSHVVNHSRRHTNKTKRSTSLHSLEVASTGSTNSSHSNILESFERMYLDEEQSGAAVKPLHLVGRHSSITEHSDTTTTGSRLSPPQSQSHSHSQTHHKHHSREHLDSSASEKPGRILFPSKRKSSADVTQMTSTTREHAPSAIDFSSASETNSTASLQSYFNSSPVPDIGNHDTDSEGGANFHTLRSMQRRGSSASSCSSSLPSSPSQQPMYSKNTFAPYVDFPKQQQHHHHSWQQPGPSQYNQQAAAQSSPFSSPPQSPMTHLPRNFPPGRGEMQYPQENIQSPYNPFRHGQEQYTAGAAAANVQFSSPEHQQQQHVYSPSHYYSTNSRSQQSPFSYPSSPNSSTNFHSSVGGGSQQHQQLTSSFHSSQFPGPHQQQQPPPPYTSPHRSHSAVLSGAFSSPQQHHSPYNSLTNSTSFHLQNLFQLAPQQVPNQTSMSLSSSSSSLSSLDGAQNQSIPQQPVANDVTNPPFPPAAQQQQIPSPATKQRQMRKKRLFAGTNQGGSRSKLGGPLRINLPKPKTPITTSGTYHTPSFKIKSTGITGLFVYDNFDTSSGVLGRGVSSVVVRAIYRDPRSEYNGRKYALKIVDLKAVRPSVIENEIQSIMDMKCDYVVRLYDAFSREGSIHMVLEYMELGALEDVCKVMPHHKIPNNVLRELAGQLMQGLAYLEEKNIVHRDIKPANCLLNKKGRCKLGDFGFSRRKKEEDILQTYQGSMTYMSPERIQGKEHSYNSDVWSLGVTILECALGRYPFREKGQPHTEGLNWWQAQNLIEQGLKIDPGEVSEDLEDFVRRCTVLDPKARPNASELLNHRFLVLESTSATRKWIKHEYKKAKIAHAGKKNDGESSFS